MTVPAELIAAARQADILSIAQRFTQLTRASSSEWSGPCPRCLGTNRFSINLKKQLFNCRHCGKGGDVIALVQLALACPFGQAIAELTGAESASEGERTPAELSTDNESQSRKARLLWASRQRLAGSIAETYLREARGYSGPLPPSLGYLRPSKPGHFPCLVCAFGLDLEAVNSVNLIRLKADGSGKAAVSDPKIAIGSHSGLPVVVAPVNGRLAICEGIEGALLVHQATGLGAWASGGAPFLPKLAPAVPPNVAVTIFADRDPPGQRYARELEQLLTKQGLDVRFDEAPP